jgi:hypothetical protein
MRTGLLSTLSLLSASFAVCQGPSTGVGVQIKPVIGNGQYCLDASGGRSADGTPVFVYQCRGSENQRWTISSSIGNEHAILGIAGLCLDVRGNMTGNGTPIQLWKCHFGDNQRFALRPDGRITEVRSGKCLIAMAPKNSSPIVLDNCKNIPQEVFAIQH